MSDEANKPQEQEEPQVFAVSKEIGGKWKFNRRDFLVAGGATAAAVAGSTVIGQPGANVMSVQNGTPPPQSTPQLEQQSACDGVRAHESGVKIKTLVISADGTLLASSDGETIKLWTLPEGGLLKTMSGHTDQIAALAISPDGRRLASASFDETVKLWSLPDGELLNTLQASGWVCDVAINSDGTLVVSGSDTVNLWSLPAGTLLKTFGDYAVSDPNWDGRPTLTITPNGELLIVAEWDSTIKLWSLPEGKLVKTLEGHTSQVMVLALNSDGTLLASGDRDGRVLLWTLPEGELATIMHPSGWIFDVALSPDGTRLAVVDAGGYVSLWSLGQDQLLPKQEEYNAMADVAISPDGTLLVTGGFGDQTVRLWSLPDANLLKTEVLDSSIKTLVISPDLKLLVIGLDDGTGGFIKLFSLPDAQLIGCLVDLAVNPPNVEAITLQLENGQIVTLPRSASIPAGAVCVCNTVGGSGCSCVGHSSSSGGGHYWYPN